MTLIWSGLGPLVAIAGFIGLLLANVLTNLLTGDHAYYSGHLLPKLAGAVLAGLFSYGAVKLLDRGNKGRVLLDPQTGQQVVLRRRDSLFFIPAAYLPYVIFAFCLLVALFARE